PQARDAYEMALTLGKRAGNHQSQAIIEGDLSTLAFEQGDYAEAQGYYLAALSTFQELNELPMEAKTWHALGMVAQEQENWAESERCYRESLALEERLG